MCILYAVVAAWTLYEAFHWLAGYAPLGIALDEALATYDDPTPELVARGLSMLIGSTYLALAGAMTFLLLALVRGTTRVGLWIIPLTGILFQLPGIYAAGRLSVTTIAEPSIHFHAFSMMVFIAGLIVWLASRSIDFERD